MIVFKEVFETEEKSYEYFTGINPAQILDFQFYPATEDKPEMLVIKTTVLVEAPVPVPLKHMRRIKEEGAVKKEYFQLEVTEKLMRPHQIVIKGEAATKVYEQLTNERNNN